MNNNQKFKTILKSSSKTEHTPFFRSLMIAGLSFIVVCLIGFITQAIVDSTGVFKRMSNGTTVNWIDLYKNNLPQFAKLKKLLYMSTCSMIISFVLVIVWTFRITRVSKGFIYTTFSLYVLSQGFSFGMLFMFIQSKALMAIFGIAGGLFTILAIIGYSSKNLMPLGKMLIIGTFVVMGFVLFSWIMGHFGVSIFAQKYGKTSMWIITSVVAALSLGWIAFDIWLLKRTSQWLDYSNADEIMRFRITWFFAFKLLSDIIGLIFQLVRMYLLTRK